MFCHVIRKKERKKNASILLKNDIAVNDLLEILIDCR